MKRLLRSLGLALLLLTLTPVYRVLDQPETGRFGGGAVLRGDAYLGTAWWGIVVALVLGAGLAYLFPSPSLRAGMARLGQFLDRVPDLLFATLAGMVAACLSLAAGLFLFQGLPTLVDGMVALLQGRMMAGGALALPLPSPASAWLIPNTILTEAGWISQYPPFPSLLLAGGLLLGAHWLVGPLMVGGCVFFSFLAARRLLPQHPGVAHLGGILMALSPFLVFLGGGYLSHLPAAASGAVVLYSALRARDGSWAWALLTGAASGVMVTSRPWLGLVAGVVLPVLVWLPRGGSGRRMKWLLARLGGATLGGLPLALLWGWYNDHFFGDPLRMGYSAAFGAPHNLGFHTDPWGNLYGPIQALGFTAQDLLALGVYLLETPIPAVAVVGLFLLLRPRTFEGLWILLGWALLPVLANVFYWHHGSHLGPRMLYEAAPAWILLTALGVVELTRRKRNGKDQPETGGGRLPRIRPADVLFWSFLISFLGMAILIPTRARSYAWDAETLERITEPDVPQGAPALVFVHGSWSERIAARLQAQGMRLDSIESALRRNDICRLHTFAMERERGAGEAGLPPIDFRLLAETPSSLEAVYITEGNRILVEPGVAFSDDCQREAHADLGGIISLAPLLWQGDLPGLERGEPLFVRDLGWEDNARIMAAFPQRTPYLFLIPTPDASPQIRSYPEGMRMLWGEEEVRPPTPEASG